MTPGAASGAREAGRKSPERRRPGTPRSDDEDDESAQCQPFPRAARRAASALPRRLPDDAASACQIGAHVCGRRVAILGVLGQQTPQHDHQPLRDVAAESGRFAEHRGERFHRGRLAERMPPARHLGQNHAEGKQVGSHIERRAFHLLWRHVVRRADDGAVGGQLSRPQLARGGVGRRQILDPLGEAEVHDLHVALLR